MGWLWLGVIGAAAFGLLWWLGAARELGWFAAAALMLGATGYAWQQHATTPGRPVRADAAPIAVDPGLVAFRDTIMPGQPGDAATLTVADHYLQKGDPGAAAEAVLREIAQRPGDAALWTGLGSMLSAHDGGQVSPAAKFAFGRALRLAPRDPGPPFFLGLAYVQTGELAAAKLAWLRTLALSPPTAPWRVDIAERLVVIDQFQAMTAGAPPTP